MGKLSGEKEPRQTGGIKLNRKM